MASSVPDKDALPLYGCVTGIVLPLETFTVATGITLRPGVFEIFSSPMLETAPNISYTAPTQAI